jgi:hypothetical protein
LRPTQDGLMKLLRNARHFRLETMMTTLTPLLRRSFGIDRADGLAQIQMIGTMNRHTKERLNIIKDMIMFLREA